MVVPAGSSVQDGANAMWSCVLLWVKQLTQSHQFWGLSHPLGSSPCLCVEVTSVCWRSLSLQIFVPCIDGCELVLLRALDLPCGSLVCVLVAGLCLSLVACSLANTWHSWNWRH